MTAADYRTYLGRLMAERIDAVEAGLDQNARYMSDLEIELDVCRTAYVTLGVTEIATLRAEFDGPLVG